MRSKIILADGVEDVQSHGALSQRFDAMDNSAGDPPDVAGSQNPGDSSDGELELARDHDSHLLVRMGMIGNDGIGLDVHDREHHAAASRGVNLDSGEYQVPRARSRRDEEILRLRRAIWLWVGCAH